MTYWFHKVYSTFLARLYDFTICSIAVFKIENSDGAFAYSHQKERGAFDSEKQFIEHAHTHTHTLKHLNKHTHLNTHKRIITYTTEVMGDG